MNKEQFNNQYNKLCEAYGLKPRPEQSRVWFERCQGLSESRFSKGCIKVIEEEIRFPSLARLLTACATIGSEARGTSGRREKCAVCDGYGFVRIGLEIFAGSCGHGARFPKMKVAPIDEQAVFAILRDQEKRFDDLYGEGHWRASTRELRNFAKHNCLPPATWL